MSDPVPVTPPLTQRRRALRDRVAEEILSAAAQVLARSGEAASMNDVATAAGIARGTLYRYFPSRQALVERLRQAAVDDAAARLEASRVDRVPPIDALERAIRAFVEVGDAFVIAARERENAGGAGFEAAVLTPLRSVIERAQADGVLRDDIPAGWLAESLLGVIFAGVSADALGKEDLIASIRLLFLEGARAR